MLRSNQFKQIYRYYRRNVKKYINRPGNANNKVENVLILLMESGWIYLVFWVRNSLFVHCCRSWDEQILLMIGDYGYYGGVFEFEWFQPNISVSV